MTPDQRAQNALSWGEAFRVASSCALFATVVVTFFDVGPENYVQYLCALLALAAVRLLGMLGCALWIAYWRSRVDG